MRVLVVAAAASMVGIGLGVARPAAAQNECAPYNGSTPAARVCHAAVDGTRAFHPVAGLLVSGGNPLLGSGGALGGLGHFAVTVRVNATRLVLPDVNYDGSTPTVRATDSLFAPAPLVEGAVGLFKGLRGGLLALDLLASAQLLPTTQIRNLTIEPGARRIGSVALGLGFGGRLGLVGESRSLPGISVSVMRRDIPQLRYGNVFAGDAYSYGVDVHATNLRLTIGKKLSVLALAAGIGWDKYTGNAAVNFRDPGTGLPAPPITIALDNSRTMAFADVGLDFRMIKLVAEAGYQAGKDQQLVTTFEGFDPTKGRFFAGAGLRVGL